MGRSGYVDDDGGDFEQWAMIRAAGARKSALRGKRGQAFLRRLAAALDAMPVKSLCAIPDTVDEYGDKIDAPGAGRLGLPDGQVCVLGSLARAEGRDPTAIDAADHDGLGRMFDVAPVIVRDLEYENDEHGHSGFGSDGTEGERRWKNLRAWVARHTLAPASAPGTGDGSGT